MSLGGSKEPLSCRAVFILGRYDREGVMQRETQSAKKPIKEMSEDELRDYNAAAQQKARDEKKSRTESRNQQPRSKHEVSKKDARGILAERGIENSHVIDVLIDLTEEAARRHKIAFNEYLLRNGLRATLSVCDGNELPELTETREIPGELISRKELHALWDVSASDLMTFEEFLANRHRCKTDCFYLGEEILGKDFHEVHQNWANFFPKFNPDTLKPGYSQEDMKTWLDAQSEKKDFLLLASRNCYKSSFAIVWLVSAILCCPDLRCLLVSETQPLAKGFIKSLRGYFEIQNANEPTPFHRLFPEYTIPAGEGSVLLFQSPLARLNLIQQTAQATSMDSSVAGQRADILLYDDPISNLSTGNEEMRQSGVEKFDLVQKLREVGGITAILGTPWATTDLYATLLKRNEEDENKPLQFRIDPAWTVKPEAKHKELKDLCESDVILLFPSRLTWKFLQKERRSNERFFRSQNLVEFVPDEDSELKINFDHDVLVQNIVSLKDLPQGENVITADIAHSYTSRYADNSAISVIRLYSNPQTQEKCMAVLTVEADRMRMSELAHRLVMLTRQYSPRNVVIEKSPAWDLIQSEIVRTAAKYSTHVPVWWCPTSNQKGAKRIRLKALEVLLAQGRLKFASGGYIDELFAELERLDGSKSSSSKKDDRADSLGLAQKLFLPAVSIDQDSKDLEESRKMLADQKAAALRNANYSRIFGSGGPSATAPTLEDSPRNYFPNLSRRG
jgi:hypothetical protein